MEPWYHFFKIQKPLQCLDIELFFQHVLVLLHPSFVVLLGVFTGDFNQVNNDDLRSLILKNQKLIESRSLNWHYNLYI